MPTKTKRPLDASVLLESAGLGDVSLAVVDGDDILKDIPSWIKAGVDLAHPIAPAARPQASPAQLDEGEQADGHEGVLGLEAEPVLAAAGRVGKGPLPSPIKAA